MTTDLATAIRDNVHHVIRQAEANRPRTLQTAVGPSGYGTDCQRKLAYLTLAWPEANTSVDPWKRAVGIAVHAYLEQMFGTSTETMPDGRPRYLVEQRLHIAPGLSGNSDLFDRQTATSIDWKIPGPTTLKEARRHGVENAYRIQAHTYGLGWANAGETVENVAVVMLPRNGDLKDTYVWTEPYDPTVVEKALARWQALIGTVAALDVEDHPERFAWIAASPSRLCAWCPFHRPFSDDLATGCPGNTGEMVPNDLLLRGVA